MIRFDTKKMRAAIKESGYKQSYICYKIGMGDSYLSRALTTGKISEENFNRVCEFVGASPSDVALDYDAPKRKYRKIPPDECVQLIVAIVQQAKQDYIALYRAEYYGKSTKGKVKGYYTSEMVEHDLNADWFANHIIGRLSENERLIDILLESWRREAIEGTAPVKRPMHWI